MALDYHWLTTLGLVTSSLIAVAANSLLLPVFFRRRGLRTISNRFVINLLITNLLSSVFLVPLLIFDGESSNHVEGFLNATVENGTSTELLFSGGKEKEEIIVEHDEVISLEIMKIDYQGAVTNSSSFLCYFAQTTTSLICTTSIFGILLIGVDQYFAVIHSLRYHSYIDKCRSTMLLAGCWLFSITLAVLGASVSADSNFWSFCRSQQETSVLRTVYSCGYFVVVILLPFATICAIYVCIYTAAHKNSERMRKSTSANSNAGTSMYAQLPVQITNEDSLADGEEVRSKELPKVHSAPNFINLENMQGTKPSSTSPAGTKVSRSSSERTGKNIIVTLKSRISNASVFRYREETRAAKISILVIFMVLICYGPYGLAVLLHGSEVSFAFDHVSLVLLVISNIVSPFLFAYRSRRIQRELFRFLKLIPAKSPTQQHSYPGKLSGNSREADEPFLNEIPKVVVEAEVEKKSILKRVCSKNWGSYKKCSFITVPDSCLDTRGSFSSASTQISTEE